LAFENRSRPAPAARPLQNKKVVVTAGPTREALDPVRFLTNASSGRMGYALAAEARRRGARVVLISGPTALRPPRGARVVRVVSAADMERAALKHASGAAAVVAAAAVADWRPAHYSARKLKKTRAAGAVLRLRRNPDILLALARRRGAKTFPRLAGFALETENMLKNAARKMREKSLDIMVANSPAALDGRRAEVFRLRPGRGAVKLRGTKPALAKRIVSALEEVLA
jgi:phosphopantothenoylcysteine decarboxylase / phosphopantothenate---cysteine ligase